MIRLKTIGMEVSIFCRIILMAFLYMQIQNIWAGKNRVINEGTSPPELFNPVSKHDEIAADPELASKLLGTISRFIPSGTSYPKTVQSYRPLSIALVKNPQFDRGKERGESSPFHRIAKSRPSQIVLLKAAQGKRNLERVQTRKPEMKLLPAAQFEATGISISNDGQWLVIAWKSHRIVSIHSLVQPGESYGVDLLSVFGFPIGYITRVEMAPDNKAMTMVFGFDTVRRLSIIDFENLTVQVPQSVRGLNSSRSSGNFSPDGRLVTHIADTGDLQVIDWRNHQLVFQSHTADTQFRSAVFEDNHTLLFTSENTIQRVKLNTNKYEKYYFPKRDGLIWDSLRYAKVSSGGQWFIASKYFAARVYSRQTGRLKLEFEFDQLREMVTSLDDKVLYMDEGGKVIGISIATGKLLSEFVSESSRIHVLKISSDGQTLVAGYSDGIIRLWNIKTGLISLQIKRKDEKAIANVWLTPDHKYLISSAYSGRGIEVWRLHVNEGRLSAIVCRLNDIFISPCTDGDADVEEEMLDKMIKLQVGE